MAQQRFTDFSEYTTGVQPSDWTVTTGDLNKWTVEADSGATGGKVLRHASGSLQTALGWDEAVDSETTQEVVARVKLTAHAATAIAAVTVRDDGVGNIPLLSQDDKGNQLIARFGVTLIDAVAHTFTAGVWYWMRFRIEGTTIKAKAWAGEPGDEPGAWEIDITHAVDVTVGRIGVIADWFKLMDVDVLGFATGGNAAPTQPVTSWERCDPALAGTTWADPDA